MSLCWWNGRLLARDEVRIAPDDAGFLFGDGLFETLRVDGGRALDVEAHLDRLLAGLSRLRVEVPEGRAALAGAIEAVAAEAPGPVSRLRVTVSLGRDGTPTRLITAAPYEPPTEAQYRDGVPVRLLHDLRIDSAGPLVGLKSLSYQANRLALHRAEAQGAWEALLTNQLGRLVEGSRCNVALAFPDGVFTPPRTDGCLPGTVRRRLLEQGELKEWPLAPDDLAAADEVLLLNSLVGVLPVSRVNRRPVPVGPVAAHLREQWWEILGRSSPG